MFLVVPGKLVSKKDAIKLLREADFWQKYHKIVDFEPGFVLILKFFSKIVAF